MTDTNQRGASQRTEQAREGGRDQAAGEPRHIVILLHGIRTRAFWYDQAKPLLNNIENVEVKPLGYGYFNALRFLFPFFTRRAPARKIADEIRKIKWSYAQKHEDIRISVIAHSFGTYTIVSVLEHEHDIDLYNLVLCGSVLPVNFDFGEIVRKVSNRLVNDAGARDAWPVIAKITSFGYGESGTYGFTSALCEDRFHDFQHSDFFTADFITNYWCPLFERNEVVPSQYRRTLETQSRVLGLLSSLPRGSVAVAALAGIFLVAAAFGASLSGSLCRQWPGAPGCATTQIVPRTALISHFIGEPVVQLGVRIENRSPRPIEATGLRLTVTAPNGVTRPLTLGAISQSAYGELNFGATVLPVPAGIAQEYYLWWAPHSWNMLGAAVTQRVKQLPEYASKLPCSNNEPLSARGTEVVRAAFESNFIWTAGNWRFMLDANLDGKRVQREVTVNFSDQDVQDLRRVADHYQQCVATHYTNFILNNGDLKTFVSKTFD